MLHAQGVQGSLVRSARTLCVPCKGAPQAAQLLRALCCLQAQRGHLAPQLCGLRSRHASVVHHGSVSGCHALLATAQRLPGSGTSYWPLRSACQPQAVSNHGAMHQEPVSSSSRRRSSSSSSSSSSGKANQGSFTWTAEEVCSWSTSWQALSSRALISLRSCGYSAGQALAAEQCRAYGRGISRLALRACLHRCCIAGGLPGRRCWQLLRDCAAVRAPQVSTGHPALRDALCGVQPHRKA